MHSSRDGVFACLVVPHEDTRGRFLCTVNLHNNCVADSDRLLKYEEKYSTQISGTPRAFTELVLLRTVISRECPFQGDHSRAEVQAGGGGE